MHSTSFFTAPAPQVTDGGISMPDVTFRRRLDGGYTIGLSGRGLLELSPQGMLYARRSGPPSGSATLADDPVGRSFFAGPEALRAGARQRLAVRAHAHLDPPPQEKLVSFA